ncbi:hypothetical protein KGF57_000320 [Candida theae]|uniref:Uncharacterized protein n=1 Tax=Candida theae TaxID=1198502 RepID=A0AAD5BJP5_9ASCO|nr:uncharacterized protein KGF57_000320 [Candida theae]KAI5967592.1 hypothetical protein KGF57_000320 [Candida theae]
MTTTSKTTDPRQLHDSPKPLNLSNPIRLAFLGGARAGKSAMISKLLLGNFRETYYPTTHLNPNLFNYEPSSEKARDILQGKVLTSNPHLHLPASIKDNSTLVTNNKSIFKKNQYYTSSSLGTSPILVELIDTPSYNPDKIVPYLEASLYTNLDKDVLHNLANEPRRPVSTSPLLVASGASELNGDINGYFLVYSAIPSFAPPGYDENDAGGLPKKHTFNLLPSIKAALDDAWEEYVTFKENWKRGQEEDVFSFKNALKNFWKANDSSIQETASAQVKPKSKSPPIWIVCTQVNSDLASSQLISKGKQLSIEWNCGFIAIDCLNDIDEVLSLMIRDIVLGKKS